MTFPFPSVPPTNSPVLLLQRVGYYNPADLSTYSAGSLNNQDIGHASAERLIVVSVLGRASTSRTVSGATLDGNSMNVDYASGSSLWPWAVLSRPTPTGTTANFSFTFSGTVQRAVFLVGALYRTGGKPISFKRQNSSALTGTNQSVTLTIGAGEIAIFNHMHLNLNAVTWTNATNWTNQFGALNIAFESSHWSAAQREGGQRTSSVTVQASWTSSAVAHLNGAVYG